MLALPILCLFPWVSSARAEDEAAVREAESPFVRVRRVDWARWHFGGRRLRWALTVSVEKRPVPHAVDWWFSGTRLAQLLAHSKPEPTWRVVSHTPTRAVFRIEGVHESDAVPRLLRYTRYAWQHDIRVRAVRHDAASARARAAKRGYAPWNAPPGPDTRLDYFESRELITRWSEERAIVLSRVARIRAALAASEETPRTREARPLLDAVEALVAEEGHVLARLRSKVYDKIHALRMADRLDLNMLHFRIHRELKGLERILVAVLPARPRADD